MAGRLYPKLIHGITYYYYQRTRREKIDPKARGKGRGSGKSRVRTKSIYLGTADSILQRLKGRRGPIDLHHRDFGFVAAIYQTAVEIGLVHLLQEHIPGDRYGLPRWLYFLLPMINRLQHATSKQRMGTWAASTVLPDLLGFDPQRLNSQTFWYATDDILSEKELRERRKKHPELKEDLFVGLDDSTFRAIEEHLFSNLEGRLDLSEHVLLYDTTNFFTYIEEPVRAHLARTGHSKDGRHHLRQVGLAMCVEKEWGIPLFHRLYRGNAHDSKTLAGLVDELVARVQTSFQQVENLVLVLDKGNNSQENFQHLKGRIQWVGSLVLSHFPDLVDLPLERYEGETETGRYHRSRRNLFGMDCVVVLTYNPRLARKQERTLRSGIHKVKQEVQKRWAAYKRKPKAVPQGITRLIAESRFGKSIHVKYKNGELVFSDTEAIDDQRKRFGKHLLWSSELEAESEWVITQYRAKQRIERDFQLLKDPELIRWRPTRHWTDTKIRAFGFCCVMALVLIQVMVQKAHRAGLRMSAALLREELTDLHDVVSIYDDHHVERRISHRSSVQQRLWDLFDLGSVERSLPYTN